MIRICTALTVAGLLVVGCTPEEPAAPIDAGPRVDHDGPPSGIDVIEPDGSSNKFCDLPGSVQHTAAGKVAVNGGSNLDKITFMELHPGFCVHYFGNVGNARQLRFAPGGELFVASPTTSTTGGGGGGRSAIVILSDDDRDGYAEVPIAFLTDLPSTQGLLFANGYFYYQDGQRILRRPYASGDRRPSTPFEVVATVDVYASAGHWPKTLDQADDGTIFVGNGGDQGETCDPLHPFHGGILKLDGSPGGRPISKGFRNPIAIRCQRGHNLCFAVELAMDYSAEYGGREKLVPIREGDDWGFPCCFTTDKPAPNIIPAPDCSGVTSEDVSFLIGDTPFGVDFEPGRWPDPYAGAAFVPVHGAYGTWAGARLVSIIVDPATGLPRAGSNLPRVSNGAMETFATGWEESGQTQGRPSSVAFSADGRLFLSNDNNGDIVWIAPLDLER
jgi:glucose/arabinose dehydrogenase